MPAHRSPQRRAYVDQLAGMLADGLSVRQAGEQLGVKHNAARAYFATVCDEVGPQSIGRWRVPWPVD